MTAQIHEHLVLDGEETTMACAPELPAGHSRIFEVDLETAEREEADPYIFSTACWRRYRGTWQIKEGRFYLIALEGTMRLRGDAPLFAEWFTGSLRVPKGEAILSFEMGFGILYEKELHIEIANGLVVETHLVDNRRKKRDQSD